MPLQQSDFEGLFEAMGARPVTIRLLDPPLHEFLPSAIDLNEEIVKARYEKTGSTDDLQRQLDIVRSLAETNPMLGTRGVRLGVIHPEIYDMQIRAIMRAAKAVRERSGAAPLLEIMIPLVAYIGEFEFMRDRVLEIGEEEGLSYPKEYLIGTMIELPRACVIAGQIARTADFFSFGTNDLTQCGIGFSRDDVEKGIIPSYIDSKILNGSPFATIDQEGVGAFVQMAVERGRAADAEM